MWVLAAPGGDDRWKRACAAALGAASIGLVVNQAIGHIWDRPRPYAAHPHGLTPLLARSHDPSFPSDHATAAFAIAFGVFFVYRRAGWLFLGFATLIAASRVLAGMHYPTDVLAGAGIGLGSGYFAARVAMQRLLVPLIHLLSRVTDPMLRRLRGTTLVRETLLHPTRRAAIVGAIGAALFMVFVQRLRANLLDEMELTLLALWLVVAVGAAALAAGPRRAFR
jgi:undecaprenyl-diphosphatase